MNPDRSGSYLDIVANKRLVFDRFLAENDPSFRYRDSESRRTRLYFRSRLPCQEALANSSITRATHLLPWTKTSILWFSLGACGLPWAWFTPIAIVGIFNALVQ